MKQPISHQFNLAQGAKFADFAGWQMPTFYSSIREEYDAVRSHIGLFDVSHMGRLYISGVQAEDFLNYLVTNDVSKLEFGQGLYTPMLNNDAGIIDDLIIYKLEADRFLLVDNAGNHQSNLRHYQEIAQNYQVTIEDISESYGQIAVQGPKAQESVNKILSIEHSPKYFWLTEQDGIYIASTGYTGERGYELYAPAVQLMQIWQQLIDEYGAKPCGLGARDVLRLEAGYCLHGNDIDTGTNPLEAGLGWTVKINKGDFVGSLALSAYKEADIKKKRLRGLVFEEGAKLIPRHGLKLRDDQGLEIGYVTSGNMSPKLERAVALAYIYGEHKSAKLNIRNKDFGADVVLAWFYRNIDSATTILEVVS